MEIVEPNNEEFLRARGYEPVQIGENFKPSDFCSLERPAGISERDIANYMKMIREGAKWGDRDFSRKALVYSEKEFMYYLIECIEE